MRAPPDDLEDAELIAALSLAWRIQCVAVRHVAIGAGGYHWVAELDDGTRRWVTVDDLYHKDYIATGPDNVFAVLVRAFDVARALRAAGLEFVLAPLPAVDGASVHRLSARYALSLFPHVLGSPGTFGSALQLEAGAALAEALARLHKAPQPGPLRRAPVDFASRAGLEAALATLDALWDTGPYAEPARVVLAANAHTVRRLIARFDALAAQTFAQDADAVITHGEAHPANVLITSDRLLLVDWDTVAIGPRERDLWFLAPDALEYYVALTGRAPREVALRFYRLRWLMEDIAVYLAVLREPHADNADTARALRAIRVSLEPDVVAPHLG